MGDKITSLRSTFSVGEEITSEDTRFLRVVIDVMHDGENLNNSFFSKEVVDSCIDSIKNTPILGFIKKDKFSDEDFKGHEYITKRTEDGVEEVYLGRAYGVIPESCNPRWVTKVCPDGIERDFVQVDALIWEKFSDATSIIKRDGEKPESMELEVSSVEGYEDEDGIFHFTKFRFDGACLLGDDVPPAMIGANVRVDNGVNFTMSDITESIRSELNDKIDLFNKVFTELISDDTKNNQGGVRNMQNANTDFAQTVMQQFEDISTIVCQYETVQDRWGDDVPRFYLADIQGDEVIVVDVADNYHYYGFPFSINGDKPEIDFACGGKRKKFVYEDYEDGSVQTGAFEFGEHISKIEEAAASKLSEAGDKVSEFEAKICDVEGKLADAEAKVGEFESKVSESDAKIADFESKICEIEQAKEELETSYSQIKSDYEEIKPKYDAYVEAEEQRAAEELIARKDAAFAEFELDLSDNADFAALKEKKDEMSVEDIEKECAFLYVKVNRAKNKFSAADTQSAVVGVLSDNDPAEADGLVLTKYGYISTNK